MEEGKTDLPENSIIFNVTGLDIPILELRQNGDILVKGNLVENDTQVVEALREFIVAE